MEPALGPHSVLVLDGPEHLRQRKLLLPPFQGSRVASFREVIREVAEREVAGWRPGAELVLRERMRALTFEVICRAVFGVTEPWRVERLRTKLIAVIDSNPLLMLVPALSVDLGPLRPRAGFRAGPARGRRAAVRGDLSPALGPGARAAHRRALAAAACPRREWSRDDRPELRDELFTMLAAGHETTATGLAFAFDLLLRNPRVLERLREESTAATRTPTWRR